jgi:hypothetical protein
MSLSLTTAPVATLQALVNGNQHGATQLFSVGNKTYFVVLEQVGNAPANALRVYKSADLVTWVLADTYTSAGPPLQTSASQDCPACVVGTVIYIIGTLIDTNFSPTRVHPVIHAFDTATGLFAADSSLSAVDIKGAGQQLWSISAYNDGTLLASYCKVIVAGVSVSLQVQKYTPGTDTWSAAVTIVSDAGSNPLQQIHDATADLQYLFYQKAATNELRCAVVNELGGFSDTSVLTFTMQFPVGSIGMPTISGTEIAIPLRVFPASGPPSLYVARATLSAAPNFTVDLVEDCSALPVNSQVQVYDQIASPGALCLTIAGLLYCFYAIDNGELDSAASQAWLYYRTSTGAGVWSAPSIAFTSAVPGELATPYATQATANDPIILVGVFDPTLFPAIGSLTNFINYGGSVVATITTIPINAQTILPIHLPDPRLGCK